MRPVIVLVDNREKSDCRLRKSTTTQLLAHVERCCRRYSAEVVTVKSLDDVERALALPVCGIILGGSSLSLSTRVQMRTFAPAVAMVTCFPHVGCLGVCFGMQVLASLHGGSVTELDEPSRGWLPVTDAEGETTVRYCNHGDAVTRLPPGFTATHFDANGVVMGMVSPPWGRIVRGLQFHPEADDDLPCEIEDFIIRRLIGHSRM
jgi:GMP synthase-like glutamine amidotransferase